MTLMSSDDLTDEHVFDPDGDVLLVLKNPHAPLAVWPDEESAQNQAANQEIDGEHSEELSTTPDAPARTVKFRLSSKHLALGSTYFYKMFNGPWMEKRGSQSDPLQLTVEDWDEEALFIVMSALHGYTDNVPRYVDQELFAKITVVIDYYQCQRFFSFYAQVWLEKRNTGKRDRWDRMDRTWPREFNRAALLWLHISWVLGNDFYFSAIIPPIQNSALCLLSSLDLPIPKAIFGMLLTPMLSGANTILVEKVEETRIAYVSSTMDEVQGKIDLLIQHDSPYTPECSSLLLGICSGISLNVGYTRCLSRHITVSASMAWITHLKHFPLLAIARTKKCQKWKFSKNPSSRVINLKGDTIRNKAVCGRDLLVLKPISRQLKVAKELPKMCRCCKTSDLLSLLRASLRFVSFRIRPCNNKDCGNLKRSNEDSISLTMVILLLSLFIQLCWSHGLYFVGDLVLGKLLNSSGWFQLSLT